MTQPKALPQRRKLSHTIPSWVGQGSRHFITINCQARESVCLCRGDVAVDLLNSARYYEEIGRWYLWLMVVMPDHVHIIATFDLERGVRPIMKAWKGYQTKNLQIKWQADFFEHRLRNDDEFVEKTHYVRMNPVRKGLVASFAAWPYVLARTDMTEKLGTIIGGAKPPAEPLARGQICGSAGRLALPGIEETGNA